MNREPDAGVASACIIFTLPSMALTGCIGCRFFLQRRPPEELEGVGTRLGSLCLAFDDCLEIVEVIFG